MGQRWLLSESNSALDSIYFGIPIGFRVSFLFSVESLHRYFEGRRVYTVVSHQRFCHIILHCPDDLDNGNDQRFDSGKQEGKGIEGSKYTLPQNVEYDSEEERCGKKDENFVGRLSPSVLGDETSRLAHNRTQSSKLVFDVCDVL